MVEAQIKYGIVEYWSNRMVKVERFINFLTQHSNVPLFPSRFFFSEFSVVNFLRPIPGGVE